MPSNDLHTKQVKPGFVAVVGYVFQEISERAGKFWKRAQMSTRSLNNILWGLALMYNAQVCK